MMKIVLVLLFSSYASLDSLVLTADSILIRHQILISLISSFFTIIGMQLGTWMIPYLNSFSVEEIVTIVLLFILLYLLDFSTKPYTILKSLVHSQNHTASVLGVLFSFNNLGFGILAGLTTLNCFWMSLFTFLFSSLFLQKTFCITKKHLLFLLITMIVCINA
ncbi:MAG: hypothetical protein IJ356_06495 [Erysipelotrichaceae bacterium]|nr:hypothetical protein [Erysipelotrichaceae bacterium]